MRWWRRKKKKDPMVERMKKKMDINTILDYDSDEVEDPPRDPNEPDTWVFPIDKEGWSEQDLGEFWHDYPAIQDNDAYTKKKKGRKSRSKVPYKGKWPKSELPTFDLGSGWDYRRLLGDPRFIRFLDKDKRRKFDRSLLNIPFFVPWRRSYPPIPPKAYDIRGPMGVIEELDRIEEYVKWHSLVFKDGSTYEGTVFNDMAQGKGVLTTPMDLCRYEGEWHQNLMEGHGVLEVDIPEIEPAPNTEFAKEMRAQGKILKADYMSPEDKKWLEMDIHDTAKKIGKYQTPGVPYESSEWIDIMGEMPERGQYRYAGEWKHGRAHGCGVIELNRRLEWGKFYFGKRLIDPGECTDEISSMHASLAEVAAAKARMFVNKPDGCVRELKGPYSDPQHPYMYEEDDLWMAPGFIHQFHEVPDVWKRYVQDVDEERETWLNSFYKSPLRIPMPPELEYWWANDPEFMVVPNFNDVEDGNELLLHVPTRQLINWTEDEEGRVRLFWQPYGREVEPEKREFLPLGFDDFMEEEETKEGKLERFTKKKEHIKEHKEVELKQKSEEKFSEEEERKDVYLELEYLDAQEKLQDLLEDIEAQLKIKQVYEVVKEREAQKKEPKGAPGPDQEKEPKGTSGADQEKEPKGAPGPDQETEPKGQQGPDQEKEPKDKPGLAQEKEPKDKPGAEDFKGGPYEDYEEEEEEEEKEEDEKPRSFGTVAFAASECYQSNSDAKMDKNRSSTPTLFASISMVSKVALHQLNPLASWIKNKHSNPSVAGSPCSECPGSVTGKSWNGIDVKLTDSPKFVNYSLSRKYVARLKAAKADQNLGCITHFRLLSRQVGSPCVLSHSCFPSAKPAKSFGSKKCRANDKRKQQQSTKILNGLGEIINGVFSLSIPLENLRC